MKTRAELREIAQFIAEYATRLMGSGVHTSRVVRNSKRLGAALSVRVMVSAFQKEMTFSVYDDESRDRDRSGVCKHHRVRRKHDLDRPQKGDCNRKCRRTLDRPSSEETRRGPARKHRRECRGQDVKFRKSVHTAMIAHPPRGSFLFGVEKCRRHEKSA